MNSTYHTNVIEMELSKVDKSIFIPYSLIPSIACTEHLLCTKRYARFQGINQSLAIYFLKKF